LTFRETSILTFVDFISFHFGRIYSVDRYHFRIIFCVVKRPSSITFSSTRSLFRVYLPSYTNWTLNAVCCAHHGSKCQVNKKKYSIVTRAVYYVKPWRPLETGRRVTSLGGCHDGRWVAEPNGAVTQPCRTHCCLGLHSARRYWLIFIPTLSLRSCGFD
jgi:hypothetical protein